MGGTKKEEYGSYLYEDRIIIASQRGYTSGHISAIGTAATEGLSRATGDTSASLTDRGNYRHWSEMATAQLPHIIYSEGSALRFKTTCDRLGFPPNGLTSNVRAI